MPTAPEKAIENLITECKKAQNWTPVILACADDAIITCPCLMEGASKGIDYVKLLLSDVIFSGSGKIRMSEIFPSVWQIHIPVGIRKSGMSVYVVLVASVSADELVIKSIDWPEQLNKGYSLLENEEEEQLAWGGAALQSFVSRLNGGFFCCRDGGDFEILMCSDTYCSLSGFTREELLGDLGGDIFDIIHPDDRERVRLELKNQLSKYGKMHIKYRIRTKSGEYKYLWEAGQRVPCEGGTVIIGGVTDISDRTAVKKGFMQDAQRYRLILESSDDMFLEWNLKTDWITFFGGRTGMFRVGDGCKLFDGGFNNISVHPDDIMRVKRMAEDIAGNKKSMTEEEVRIMGREENYGWFRIRAVSQQDEKGCPDKAIIVISDINKEKEKVHTLTVKAERDGLTGLYNKAAAEQYSDIYISESTEDRMCALMIIDVDNFKSINDTYGHLGGDVLLSDIARVIKSRFRDDDVVGRIGGDEFAVLMKGITTSEVAERKAAQLIRDMAGMLAGNSEIALPITCSIGIAMSPLHGKKFSTIYEKADSALYRAKIEGKNRYAFYSDEKDTNNSGEYCTSVGKIDLSAAGPEEKTGGRGFAEYIFQLLYSTNRSDISLDNVLGIVGMRFGVGASFICVRDEKTGNYICRHAWERTGTDSELKGKVMQSFSEDGMHYCGDIRVIDESKRELVASEGTKSFIRRVVKKGDRPVGFIGFDNHGENGSWSYHTVDTLRLISEIIGVFAFEL